MARKSRLTYRQRKERKETLQIIGLLAGSIIALPFVAIAAGVYGDIMAKTNYTGLAVKALSNLFI